MSRSHHKMTYNMTKIKPALWFLIGQLAINHLPFGARQRKARTVKFSQIEKISFLVRSKMKSRSWKSTHLCFWGKVKRSSHKFALEVFILIYFAATWSKVFFLGEQNLSLKVWELKFTNSKIYKFFTSFDNVCLFFCSSINCIG